MNDAENRPEGTYNEAVLASSHLYFDVECYHEGVHSTYAPY